VAARPSRGSIAGERSLSHRTTLSSQRLEPWLRRGVERDGHGAASMLAPAALVRRCVTNALLLVAAIVLLVEEWLWDRGTEGLARLGRLPVLRTLEAWCRARPPGQALALFVVPVAVVYPCKMLAVLAVGMGYVTLGIAAFLLAKVVATALFARLYQITEPAIMQYAALRRGRDRFLRARRFIHCWLNRRPFYRQARYRVRTQTGRMARRYRAVYRLQNQRRRAATRGGLGAHWAAGRR